MNATGGPVKNVVWVRISERYRVGQLQSPNPWTYLRQNSKEFSSLLFTVTTTKGFYPPPSKSGLKLVFNLNIVYKNLKSENCQKPKQHFTFRNSSSGHLCP